MQAQASAALAAAPPARSSGGAATAAACRRGAAAPLRRGVAACAAGGSAKEVLERAADRSEPANEPGFDARAFRRSLNTTGRYTRKPSNDPDSLALMEEHGVGYSTSGLVAQMRETGYAWKQGDVTVKLAEAYGFCWGVERAVQMAYEARKAYPGQRLHITNEIIHNPGVNQRLKEMDVQFIDQGPDGEKDFSGVKSGEVVILPAFGASVQELRLLNERQVQIVDTTCPWVSKVWNAVDNQTRKGHTSIIHGKWEHEETIATASFAGTYVIVKGLAEAEYVCDYILNGGNREEFLAKFSNAMSPGFDPDRDLERIGMANQTTMLKGETEAIGKLLEKTQLKKYGPAELSSRFMIMDTICDATQERQDAVYKLTGAQGTAEGVDIMLVVGGFNSSNTSHLQEIPELKDIPSFWVDSAARINVDANKVTHKLAHGELVETANWLPEGPLVIGVTSGASTPDKAVEDVLDRVFRIKDPSFAGIAPRKAAVKKAAHEEE
ncbi:4-hydroxy-3-methylbut-2-enyl diphosphate reductase [Micractinium conductrix]|uniref:4-hydroxy-3-methylbut-2-enyl diphosphate reductase n=1 Tax=Micractinium conductrix TaxID=554055 RepID=A0A2P6V1S4_9CHLO|nr:4-hydroxy-3-methylbut-2-enyl diphosphate reductase [Micractinium conductrix]|eukprot:PSC68040.1 4-hydroxy-3-methylbut-2-enyl diphosphate reductase [Micractinium conductrix]